MPDTIDPRYNSNSVRYIENTDRNTLSRYNAIDLLIDVNGNAIQSAWLREAYEQRDDDIFFDVGPEHEHRPDLIAQEVYGSSWLYWIVAFAGGMTDAFAETYIGLKLRLPSHEHVFGTILQNK
jgi:hypothetical protein